MNVQQAKTVRRLAVAGVLAFALAIYLLVIELQAVAQGGDSTISRITWGLWALQPWVIFLVSHLIAAPSWFLAGHFVSQSQRVYDDIRKGDA